MVNIAKLLKDAPKGMKLYSPLFGEVELVSVNNACTKIRVIYNECFPKDFLSDGRYLDFPNAECLLFPSKECRTWEGWKAPVEPNFKVGDWAIDKYITDCVFQITKILDNSYEITEKDGHVVSCLQCDIDDNSRLWTIQDAKDCDVLVDVYGNISIYEKCDDFDWMSYCSLGHNGGFQHFKIEHENEKTYPATKEQRDLLFAKMQEAGYQWDADKKELRKIIEPNFKVGNWIVRNNGSSDVPIQVYGLKNDRYLVTNMLGSKGEVMLTRQDKWHLWSIQDAIDGDVLVTEDYIFIFKYILHGGVHLYCHYNIDDEEFDSDIPDAIIGNIHDKGAHFHPATKEQRDLLVKKMKESGYTWDENKKELRKIIKPMFKVGDKIEATIYGINRKVTIRGVDKTNRCYLGTHAECIGFSEQDQWHLAPKPHYDIANFYAGMPVLVRDRNENEWCHSWYSHYCKSGICHFNAVGLYWKQCIPFEGNEALLGTTKMPSEEFINW